MEKVSLEGEDIGIIHHFLSQEECIKLIDRSESTGFKKSPPSGGGHGRTGREDARNNKYTIITDQNLANSLFKRVKDLVPEDLTFIAKSPYFGSAGGSEWKLSGLVERFRVYKYDVDEEYPEHMDGSYKRKIINEKGENIVEQSFLTLLIYLNDNFEGGHTRFFPEKQHCRFLRDIENKIPTVVVKPQEGSALVNIHSILHEGSSVTSGTKYVVRTDILYQRIIPQNQKLAKFENNLIPTITEWEKIFEPSCKMYHD